MLREISNKRDYVARAFERLGLLALLERTIVRQWPALVVLTYHRIAEPGANSFYDPVISATRDSFRAQVNWLYNHVRLLTMDELVSQVDSALTWREPTMLLTFDDGYRDNFDVAVPILREHNVPATFFIPTAFFESPSLPWWDHVAYVIKQTQVQQLVLDRNANSELPLLQIDLQSVSRTDAIMTIIRAFLDQNIADQRWFLSQLEERAKVAVDSESLARELFMSWDQVRHLDELEVGFAIGSHAHSHRRLADLDADTQRHELSDSKQILEAHLGHKIKGIAYPYGWPGTYTALTKTLAAQAGFRLAFASREGVNRFAKFDPYEISRLGVGSADSAALLRARSTLHTAFGRSFL